MTNDAFKTLIVIIFLAHPLSKTFCRPCSSFPIILSGDILQDRLRPIKKANKVKNTIESKH